MPKESPRTCEETHLPREMGEIALLYVEDEADARVMVAKMLEMNYPKLTIYHAENGASGLELYRKQRPDIVMTDINMPVMDGIKMSREIKAINPEVHIIAVTAHSDTSYLLSAIEIGVHHYVLKPLNYQELFAVIDKVLEQVALKRLVWEQNQRIVESEKQLAGSQRIAHLGSWEWQVESGGMKWSDELYRICGLDPGALTPGYQRFLELFAAEDRPVIEELMHDALKKEAVEDHRFCRVFRPDGSRRIVRVEADLLPEDQGQKETVIGTCHDVTELKEAEEQVRLLTEDLERRVTQRTSLLQATVSELESFSYFVSHDLRAPVARLEGYCRALLEDCGSRGHGSCRQYAERAEHVAQQIKQIIEAFNSLTHYARCALSIGETDLSAVVAEAAWELEQGEPQRRVEVQVEPGIRVRGDAKLLRTALRELLKNAWKFTSKAEFGRIEFGKREQEGVAVYFVRDNGAGFNMKYADKLFKPFQTVHTPGEFDRNGPGIGLAKVHSIILRHGGRIWAEGEVGRGAIFSFTLEPNPETGSYLTQGLRSQEQRG
ncbi:response receiver histidine kinase [Geoanaerobacter pelophilus]|uniref:histidine kinase n=1 Tax=Geoanaerobacter pelophilus TaxID=60036 RepID=A0ABQ0MHC7_9BACT|nr:response regulator [Geoanaerobacter pelophilus]GAW66403.1 response receiver histidine kinase [Geoanaerobacter pelophilus]